MDLFNNFMSYVDTAMEYTNQFLYPQEVHEDGICSSTYHLKDDIIVVNYYKNNKLYTLVVDRLCEKAPEKIVEECLAEDDEEHIMMAVLNDKDDITKELNSIVGPNGKHLEYYNKIKISWLLTEEEEETFESLQITDMMCDEFIFKDTFKTLKLE